MLFLIQEQKEVICGGEKKKKRGKKKSPGGSDSKASACNMGDPGTIPGLGRFPWRRKWQPTPVLLPGKFHGLRSLVGYSPWGCKESDTSEQLHIIFYTFIVVVLSLLSKLSNLYNLNR